MKDETLVQHPKRITPPEGNIPVTEPIYQSVKFTVEREADLHRQDFFFYSRHTNPTVSTLEAQLASLQKTEAAVCVGSGCAAISTVFLSLLKSGDHVILPVECYKPSRYLTRDLLAGFGVETTLVSISDLPQVEKAIRPGKTKLLFVESPTHLLARVPDLKKLSTLAKKSGVLFALDNTFSGFHNHADVGIDLYIHSLTKFASGHGDVMGGAILGSKKLVEKTHHVAAEVGPVLDPHSAFLISRGLKTYFLRYRRQCETATFLADHLSKNKLVERVWYPGLPSHPDHAIAKTQMKDFGAVVFVDIRGKLPRFLDSLRLFVLTASLGSTESLAAPVKLFYAPGLTDQEVRSVGISDQTVRLSIGLEDARDLADDLDQALNLAR